MTTPRPVRALRAALVLGLFAFAPPAGAAPPSHLPDKSEPALNAGLGDPPKGLDRSTPRRAWRAFLAYAKAGRFEHAAHLLNLGDVRPEQQRDLGPTLAQKLYAVLARAKLTPLDAIPDTPLGPLEDSRPKNYVVVARLDAGAGSGEVWLRRVTDERRGEAVWVVTRKTVSQLDAWLAALRGGGAATKAVRVVNVGLGPIPPNLSLGTPADTAATFARLVAAGDFTTAARLLDLRALPPAAQRARGPRLARRLALLLARALPAGFGSLSNDEFGAPEKGVPPDQEVVAATTVQGVPVEIRLARIPRQGAGAVWLFSADTVARIDPLYAAIGYGWAGDHLPLVFFETRFAGVQLWQWIGLLAGLALCLVFGFAASFVTRKALLRLARFTPWAWDDEIVGATRGPLVLIYLALGMLVVGTVLRLADSPHAVLLRGCKLLAILGGGWILVRTVDVAAAVLEETLRKRGDEMGRAMIPVARKIVKPIMAALVLVVALQNAGIQVTGLLAGLGIGGLALAMASKTTVENMIGGLTIALDRPFAVGDFVKVGGFAGTVEEVGLRSTRIRTLERTLVTIPNGQMADAKVENVAPRDRIRLDVTIGLQYDTTVEQVQYVIDELKRHLLAHAQVADGFRVRLVAFGESSVDIQALLYFTTRDFGEFTALREALLFEVHRIVGEAGAQFAFPSRTVYQAKAEGADARRAKQIAAEVRRRAEAGELTIPEIPPDLAERVRGDGA